MKRRNFLWYSLLFVSGCSTARNGIDRSSTSTESQSRRLRFAVTDLDNLEEVQRYYGEFKAALAEVLTNEIEFVLLPTYTAAVAALPLGQVDLILTGPSEYVVLNARTNAVPIVAFTRPNYRSVITVRADSGIQSVADLKGKAIAMWDVGSTSGHLGPTKLLIDAGLDPQQDVEIRMLEDAGLPALKNSEINAWGGGIQRYESFVEAEGLSDNELSLIATGPLLPSDVFVASSQLDPSLIRDIRSRMLENKDKLLQSLLSADDDKYEDAELVLANDADYNMIREVYKAIGQGDFIQ